MRNKRVVVFAVITLVLSLVSTHSRSFAEGETPPRPPGQVTGDESGGPRMDEHGFWYLPEGRSSQGKKDEFGSTAADTSSGGPDEFGYTWDDTITYSWIDTSGGTDTGMSGSDDAVGPISLPFPFKFYENTYSELYISSSGYISFTEPDYWDSQSDIPSFEEPNNVIAPYWTPTYIGSGAWVHYLSGGSAPNRYFVVEWHDLSGPNSEDFLDERYRFQMILHENGNIDFQYQTMELIGPAVCGSAGIENARGRDGLAYLSLCDHPPSTTGAVRFTRPAPAARVQVLPEKQGQFFSPGEEHSFEFSILNTGDLGTDTYDLKSSSNWSVSFFSSDGTTPLTDTDGDGMVDTGPIPQGASLSIVSKVKADGSAQVGHVGATEITVQSSVDTAVSDTAPLHGAVPPRFAQVYTDYYDGAMSLYLVKPDGRTVIEASPDSEYGSGLAVAQAPNGDYVYGWTQSRGVDSIWVSETKYAILDHAGNTVLPPTKITDHSGATTNMYDLEPSFAVTQNGNIGAVWTQLQYDQSTGEQKSNVFFAVLDNSGGFIHGPENITQNTLWEYPRYQNPHIAVIGSNRFILAWGKSYLDENDNYFQETMYGIREANGGVAKSSTKLGDGWSPNLTSLSGNKAILVDGFGLDISFTVLDDAGSIIEGPTEIVGDGGATYDYLPDAVQLSDGKILVAWSSDQGIRFAVLDSSYNISSGPKTLMGIGELEDDFVSVAPARDGRGVLTWMERDWYLGRHLYYALVNSDGDVLTSPMIFKSGQSTSNPRIVSSYSGQGNAPYTLFSDVSLNHWAHDFIEAIYQSGLTSGCSTDPLMYCPGSAVTRAEMAVFLEKGIHYPNWYSPPDVEPSFGDTANHWAEDWIEALYSDGITSGCSADPLLYCPDAGTTRAQMAVFLLKSKHGAGYTPPDVAPTFNDTVGHWAEDWIEQLAAEGITAGCGSGNYCPEQPVTRAQMAVFLTRTFGLLSP